MTTGSNTHQTEREELEEWRDFLRSEAHVLGRHPALLFQQAANRPEGVAVGKAANARWQTQIERRPWVRWVNKPVFPDPCITTLTGHRTSVTACAYSPDGTRIVSASEDNTLRLWDAATGAQIAVFDGHSEKVTACVFSPDGRRMVSASVDKTLIVWDTESQRMIATLVGHSWEVNACDHSPDGIHVVSASGDGSVRVWDTASATEVAILSGHSKPVWACAYSPDGKQIISGGSDDVVRIWDVELLNEIATLRGHADRVESCCYSPDGTRIVSASRDHTLRIWDVESASAIATLRGHSNWVSACRYSPDGKHIASSSWDGSVKIWLARFEPWPEYRRGPADINFASAAFIGHASYINACAYSPDGQLILTGSFDASLKVWDTDMPYDMTLVSGRLSDITEQCAFSPDGKRLASTTSSTLTIWDAETAEMLDTMTGEKPRGYSSQRKKTCAYSPDGNQVVTASETVIQLWDIPNRRRFGTLRGHTSFVNACSYSPDGRRVVSGSSDSTLKLWDAATLSEIATLKGHTGTVIACQFAPDGRRVLSASDDQSMLIWDADTGAVVKRIIDQSDRTKSCAYSSDGRRIASATHEAWKIWDASTGSELMRFRAHLNISDTVFDFALDGTRLIYASDEGGPFWLYDAVSGEELACFVAPGWLSVLSFDSSIQHLAAADLNATVYVLKRMTRKQNRDALFTTIVRLYLFDSLSWSSELTARCQRCGEKFTAPSEVVDAIEGITRNARLASEQSPCNLPGAAWGEPRLICECPNCHQPLRYNPFIVDDRYRY